MHVLFFLSGLAFLSKSHAQDLTGYVLPDTGSINGGNTFPGVSLPLGVVKLGPDLYTGSDSYSGYQPTGNFTGFSLLHESGTGGAPKYGVVSQMPVVGNIVNPLADHNDTRAAPDVTRVGYYKASLGSGTVVEMSAANRAGLYLYTFPKGTNHSASSNNIIVDVSHVLPSYRGQGLGQNYLDGAISVIESEPGTTRYTGLGSYDNGWNRSPRWTVYFCGSLDQPATFKTFVGTDKLGSTLAAYDTTSNVSSTTARLGAVFSFEATEVTSRVGVSFISAKQACRNLDDEITTDNTIASLEADAKTAWNDNVLSKITTTDTDTTNLQLLYSSLYHMSIIPTNKTGENPLWTSSEPYYDDIFTLWDLFRCTMPLFHILQPVAYEEFIRSLVDIWRNDDFLPDGRSSFFNGATQGGSNADNVLADAYVKGVRGAINWGDAFSAMVSDAETVPPNNNDARDLSSSTKEGRGALPDWLEYGYITTEYGRSVSRAVEYAANDFGLYQVAKGLGKTSDAQRYLSRSQNWRNHWNTDMSWNNFTGFLGPIAPGGSFIPQDPLSCGGCYWGDYYYQGLPIEYSFNAHHDIDHLISLCDGEDEFVRRLEVMFTPGMNPTGSATFNYTLFNPGNEPSFTTPFLFNYAGRQDLAVKYSRFVAKSYYHPTPAGLPGNSDAGAMESWVLWVMLGLYPMTGQTSFLIGSPWFRDLTIHLGGGNELHITTTGGAEESYYVQSLKVNGEDWNKAWVTWEDVFANGGTMEYILGPEPVDWATGPMPPSPASVSSYGGVGEGEDSGGDLSDKRDALGVGGATGYMALPLVVVLPMLGALALGFVCGWRWSRQWMSRIAAKSKVWTVTRWGADRKQVHVDENSLSDVEKGSNEK
ncbi:glycoside hydrolase family 92 protein [Pseudomassariella vexata]|uniref:Glycoside hydrolase family 92 protein n=1 Tax=Pseudomassariella vexata TaxID=1141098 RepID=A0A1Y2DUW5_9PEZI|nr:glycoside hydrolase family 92 protein [Pseudomassariella vexata]ORY62936.1 glycoside hydrolase family 92 protein [Pseudomassariella vexata]